MASILVVDDDEDLRHLVARYLEKSGYVVRCASNGAEALTVMGDCEIDAVILDVVMPAMNGPSLIEVMRCYLRWANLPVILLTGHPNGDETVRANNLGVKKLFVKSRFDFPMLLDCLTDVLEGGSH